MIRSEDEYQEAVKRIKAEKVRMAAEKSRLEAERLTTAQIQRLLDPMQSFHLQFVEEVEAYERLKRGDFDELLNFHGIGPLLIGVRIYLGVSQRHLAEKLGVHESQVSRDERNEYHGITLERTTKILDVLGVSLRTTVEVPAPSAA
jgi:hypothetical protein